MLNVGIDWGEKTLNTFSILNEEKVFVKEGQVERSVAGALNLIDQIKEFQTDPDKVRIGIDRKNDVLTRVLHSKGYQVFPLNPLSAERARKIYWPSGKKDDYTDSKVHALMIANDYQMWEPLKEENKRNKQIQSLLQTRNSLARMQAQNRQRLGSILSEATPVISELCKNLRLCWVKDFLNTWPLHQDFHKAHGNRLNAFLNNHRVSDSTRKQIRSAWQKQPYEHDRETAECYRLRIQTLMDTISCLEEKIDRIEDKISKLSAEHKDREIFSSLPTNSENTIAALCTAFGPDRDQSYSWRNYSAFFGTSPITEESGKSKTVHMRQSRDSVIYKALMDFADSTSRQEDCWAHTYYGRKRREGKSHYHALRCLASRWVKILHTMWKKRTKYDEDFHRRRRQERGSMGSAKPTEVGKKENLSA